MALKLAINLDYFTEYTKCDISHVYCRSVTEQVRFEINQQSPQHMTDGDLGQEG